MRLIDADDKENIVIVQDDRGMFKRIDAPTVKAVPIEVLQEIRAEIQFAESNNPLSAVYTTAFTDGLLRAIYIIDNHLKEYEDEVDN